MWITGIIGNASMLICCVNCQNIREKKKIQRIQKIYNTRNTKNISIFDDEETKKRNSRLLTVEIYYLAHTVGNYPTNSDEY